ncbi:MAG: hypothetical protein WBK20_10700 [Spirochaetota bacterium]
MKKSFFVWLAAILMMTACGNDGGGSSDNYTPSVYVVGNVYEVGKGTIACYWKDGVRTDLKIEGKSSVATGIAVSNGNVYVIGEVGNTNDAYLWVNGVKQELSNIKSPSAIKVVGNTVYIAGSKEEGIDNYKACVWINGTVSAVDTENSGANGIEVTNDTIYLGSTEKIETPEKINCYKK